MEDFRTLLVRNKDKSLTLFEHLKVGKFYLSIQASEFHYCNPKITMDNLYLYKEWELAIFDEEIEWVYPEEDDRFKNETWSGYFEQVGGYIPTKTVQEIFEFLCNLEG